MNRIRTFTAGATVVVITGAAVASGAVAGSPDVPPVKPLAQAIHDALVAPPVPGITARISFTNKLIDSSSLVGGGPLLVGAKGRLWIANDGRARIELQSDRGDAQIVSDGKTLTVYDASSNTAYEAALPQDTKESGDAAGTTPDHPESTTPPSVAKITDLLAKVEKGVDISGPDVTNVAGRGAYSVKLAPHHGGLIGQAEIAWDAASGIPLRAGIYAAGATKPVIELAATDISYGPVDQSALSVPVPAGAKVEKIDFGQSDSGSGDDHAAAGTTPDAQRPAAITDPAKIQAALSFTLSAPGTLGGMPRSSMRLLSHPAKGQKGPSGALVTYGEGLGGIAVLETPVPPTQHGPATTPAPSSTGMGGGHGDTQGITIPSITINGAKGTELSTALGTLVRFQRGGVQYTVVGSVTSAVAEAAARGL